MTTLGHIIVGASIGVLSTPAKQSRWRAVGYMIAIIAAANIPDWPLPGWGHARLTFSHSLFVNAVIIFCTTCILTRLAWTTMTSQYKTLLIGCIAAWLSHFLLDTLYGDMGVAILWPFSTATVSLPIPWLRTMPHVPPPFDKAIWHILLMELLTFTPLLIAAMVIRTRWAPQPGRISSR